MKTFEELGLSKEVLQVVRKLGFKEPSQIQEQAIPLALAGKDIIGGSATGSGKTLAFASPIIEKIKPNGHIQALILTPTRELAEQVAKSIREFSQYKNLNVLAVYGGVDIVTQTRKLARTDIVVATPGRVLDHLKRRTIRLDYVKFLVLDEVDRMFDMGFHRDVETILRECPKERQTMLFSATISSDLDHLAQKHTKNAVEVSVESHVDTSKLKQTYYDVPSNMKFSLLVQLLKGEKSQLVMVFCNTRRNADFVVDNLNRLGIDSTAIHGGFDQKKRIRVLKEFHGKNVHVLVCTDVAARGLDIKNVSHVYNYDLPKQSADYIHRIGRTARAGEEGKAVSILSSRDYENFGNILRDDSIKIIPEKLPYINRVNINITPSRESSRRDGPRKYSRDGGPRRSESGRDGPKRQSSGRDSPRRYSGSSGLRSSSGGDGFKRQSSSRDGPRRYSNSGGPRNSGSRDEPRRGGSKEGQRKFSQKNRSRR